MDFSDCEVLITGGAGFIGSSLARRLVALGAKLTLVDSMLPDYGGNLYNLHGIRDQVSLNITDVRDSHAMRHLAQGKDLILNLAGQTSHMDSMSDPFTDLEINSRSQLSILETVRHYNPTARVVFASTRQIYGRPDYLPVDENHPKRPVDVNGINKIAGEDYHLLYHDVYNIPTSALRLTNTYGPCMRIKDARQTFLGIWIRRLLEDQPIEVWGGSQLRDFNFVDDVVDAFLDIAACPAADGQVFNLGSREVVSLEQLARMLVEIAGKGSYVIRQFPEERKRIDIGDYYSDFSKLHGLVGWQPKVELADGLRRTMEYFVSHSEPYL